MFKNKVLKFLLFFIIFGRKKSLFSTFLNIFTIDINAKKISIFLTRHNSIEILLTGLRKIF